MGLLYLVLGVIGLLIGAELAVKGAIGLAKRWGWPSWLTGLVLLALGTSLPELFVSGAAAREFPELALGNIFGSNAFNTAVVLGMMLIVVPNGRLPLVGVSFGVGAILMLGCGLSFFGLAGPEVHWWIGPVYGVLYVAVIWLGLRSNRIRVDDSDILPEGEVPKGHRSAYWHFYVMVAGFAVLALAADAFKEGALEVAGFLGWGTGFTGYLVAAVGTSAPELFTSLRAARHGHPGAVLGNIFGSNAFNLLIVGGLIGALADVSVDVRALRPMLWINFAACLIPFIPDLGRKWMGNDRVYGTRTGVFLVLAYLLTIWLVFAT